MDLEAPRDIDILFVGTLHDALRRERARWLSRLASMGRRWNVVIRTAVSDEEREQLMCRTRIVFNRTWCGECNPRVFETIAAGALLFQEQDNREVPELLTAGAHFVDYSERNLEERLERYLNDEPERARLAVNAREWLARTAPAAFWMRHLGDLGGAEARSSSRAFPDDETRFQARLWGHLCHPDGVESLDSDLQRAIAADPSNAFLHSARGFTAALSSGSNSSTQAAAAFPHFRIATELDPSHAMHRLNLAEAASVVDRGEALREAKLLLESVRANPDMLIIGRSIPHFPPGWDYFRVEWERAGHQHAGDARGESDAKQTLMIWRLNGLLARLTGELVYRHEAALARSDLAPTRAALGGALVQAGHRSEALPHLRLAVRENPFDRKTARLLDSVLGDLGLIPEQAAHRRSQHLLAKAIPQAVAAEPWFSTPLVRPAETGLVSIIVPCCNALDYTRLCLESVRKHTASPFELIVVDNGSTDGTDKFLESLRLTWKPEPMIVIRNENNRGFPAAVNQGVRAANGDSLLLLNNDTVVTPGWLSRLLLELNSADRPVGMVGPVTNFASNLQKVETSYQSLEELDEFAARLQRESAGQSRDISLLSGFCLLIKREAWQAAGGLDERYGLGFFEDNDLCLRVRAAGYRLRLAASTFVHHFGSRTFQSLGVDCRRHLHDNFGIFREKWGEKAVQSYTLPPLQNPVHETKRRSCRVSLCMIVKNEESNLEVCLAGLAELFDEIVVVDTGSVDRTKEIALRNGAKVYDYPWTDSFADARNESLRHATGEWAFWLDADDRLDNTARASLRSLFAKLDSDPAVYLMRCWIRHGPGVRPTAVDHARLFRIDPLVRWEYRVHEQILASAQRQGWKVRRAPVDIHHDGYVDFSGRASKHARNQRLLELENRERPADPFVLFNLGTIEMESGRLESAISYWERSIDCSPEGYSVIPKAFALLILALRRSRGADAALSRCTEARRRFPEDAELLYSHAILLLETRRSAEAETMFRHVLTRKPSSGLSGLDPGMFGYKSRHNLAEALRDQGKHDASIAEWKLVLAEVPDYLPSWLGIGSVLAAAGRLSELADEAVRAEAAGQSGVAALLRGQLHLATGDAASAARVLDPAARADPRSVPHRVLLAEARFRLGDSDAMAESAREILAIDPDHAPSRARLRSLQPIVQPATSRPTLSIIIPSMGRPSIRRALESIRGQSSLEGIEVIVVIDGERPDLKSLLLEMGLPGRVLSMGRSHRDWGHTPANHAIPFASKQYLMRLDDDNVYESDAIQTIQRVLAGKPAVPHVFRVRRGLPHGDVLWKDPVLVEGNVDSLMFVVPNQPDRLGAWGSRYAGDFDFISSTAALYPSGSLVWRPEIIGTWRPDAHRSS
jgi:glycosyltransferase involved in cell wall biosynthesis